ncbi:MAG: tyrosine-type recombinase/integrase [Bacteroidota bacterium]
MSFPIKPVCKKALVRKDGTSIIFIQYCHSAEKRTLLNTGISIPPTYWSPKKLRVNDDLPALYGRADELNEQLRNAIRLSEDILTYAVKNKVVDPMVFLKETFKPGLSMNIVEHQSKEIQEKVVNLSVFFQLEDYMKSKERQVSPRMMNVFRNMRDTLKAFEKFRGTPITFESFDYNFYEEFVDYMKYEHVQRRRKETIKGFRISTLGKTIKQLRIFLRNRMRRKIISPINLDDFKILDEEADAIYLSREEITKICHADLSGHPALIKYRNLFVFGCLTGMRFSDFSTLKSEDLRGRMLHKKQKKSSHWVVIPLREEAYTIFVDDFGRNIPQFSNEKFNKYIKDVARLAGITELIKFSHKKGNLDNVIIKPKCDWVTSHTCRRSFCTNEFLAGTPVDLIMKISGHKSSRDFYRYIKISPEEAGKKIQEIWENRGEMNLVNEERKARENSGVARVKLSVVK